MLLETYPYDHRARSASFREFEARVRQELEYTCPGFDDDENVWFLYDRERAFLLILAELPKKHPPLFHDWLVRRLCLYLKPYDAAPLCALYDRTPYANLRYAIANTLAHSKARNVTEWLDQRLGEDEREGATEPLLLAGQRHLPRDRARAHAERHLEALPGHAASVLRIVGDAESLRRLREMEPTIQNSHKWIRTAFAKAIARLATKFPEPGGEEPQLRIVEPDRG